MKEMLRFSAWIDWLNAGIGRAVAWLGLLAVLVCTGNAAARYLFDTASNAWLELQWYFNSAVFLLVAAWTLLRNEHVRIDVINGRLSPRMQAWIDIVGGLLFLLPTVIIISGGLPPPLPFPAPSLPRPAASAGKCPWCSPRHGAKPPPSPAYPQPSVRADPG